MTEVVAMTRDGMPIVARPAGDMPIGKVVVIPGKKKQAVAGKEPKIKIVSAPSGSGKRGRKGKKRDDADEDPDKLPPAAGTWPEHSDPFGSTRRQLEVKPATVPSTPNGKAKKAK